MLRAALGVAVLAVVGSLAADRPRPASRASATAELSARPMPCPPRHLPEGGDCIPLPAPEASVTERSERALGEPFLPRASDRPSELERYAGPLQGPLQPIESHAMAASAEGRVLLSASRGERVELVALEGQEGDARVVGLGRLLGHTVVTAHEVRLGTERRTVLLVHGRLDAIGPDLEVGATRPARALLGFAGDSGDPGVVGLAFEARLVRVGVTLEGLTLPRLVDPATSVRVDLRNALTLHH